MKKLKAALKIVAFGWIALAAVAAVAAQVRTATTIKPIVVKGNLPILFPKEKSELGVGMYSNGIPVDVQVAINFQSFPGGPTNLNLRTYFVDVVKVGTSWFLSNSLPVTTSNYLVSDPDWFNGDTNVPLSTSESCWETVNFQMNGSAMSSNNVRDAALLFVGSAPTVITNYETGYSFAVQNRSANTTNFWFPVASSAEQKTNNPVFETGVDEMLEIFNGGMTNVINTNMTFKMYLAATLANTNGSYSLTNLTANFNSSWFETNNTNYYKGGASIALQSSGTTPVLFKLKPQKFIDEAIPDCLLVVVGVSTNATNKCQIAYVYPIDSPYEPEESKKADKPKKK